MPADHLLIGKSTITFAADTRRVSLQLSPAAQIESVSISGAKIPFSFAGGALSLDIPETAGQGTVLVTVAYRALFNDPLPLHPGSSEDPTYGVNGAITTAGHLSRRWRRMVPGTVVNAAKPLCPDRRTGGDRGCDGREKGVEGDGG